MPDKNPSTNAPVIHMHHGDYRHVLEHVRADLIFTSPPYNIGSKQERRDGQRKFGKFDPKSFGAITDYPDNLPEDTYHAQQLEFLYWAAAHLQPHGVFVYNHKPRRNCRLIHPAEWILDCNDLVLMEEIIWDRGSTHNHCNNMCWPQTERLYVLRKPDAKYRFRNTASTISFRSDIWHIQRAPKNGHNAPFPQTLADAVVKGWSRHGELVCDPYAGSGTVAIACKQLGRHFEGAEIEEKYYRLANSHLASTELDTMPFKRIA